MHNLAVLAVIATTCLASASHLAAQQAARIDVPAGVSARLPTGWQAGSREATQLQLVPANLVPGEVVFIASASADGATSLTDPALIRRTEQEMLQLFPVMRRVGAPVLVRSGLGQGIRMDWEGTPPDGVLRRLSMHAALHQGQVVTVMAAGPRRQVLARAAELQALFTSLAPSQPVTNVGGSAPTPSSLDDRSGVAREWVTLLRGKKLTRLSGYGSGGGSGGMTSRSDLILLADGRFTYASSSSVSISVDGMGGSSAGRNASEGRWRIVSRGGSPVLELVHSGGNRDQIALSRDGTKTLLDGGRWFVTEP